MPYLMSVSSAMYYDNNEQRVYFTRCNRDLTGCGWEDSESHSDPADCEATECPECGSESIVDESEYV